MQQCSVPVPVPRRSARTVMLEAEVEHEILGPIAVTRWLQVHLSPIPSLPLRNFLLRNFDLLRPTLIS